MLLSFRKFDLPHLYITKVNGEWCMVNTKLNKVLRIRHKKIVNDLNELYNDYQNHNYSMTSEDLEFILILSVMAMEGVI
jgi:hypothetical protein